MRATTSIMLVDDEPFILKLHNHLLNDLGYVSTRIHESGAQALADMDLHPHPELILLDLSMPGMDGIEFIRHLVTRRFAGSLVLVSGEDERLLQSAERLVKAHGLHVLGHLAKPIQKSSLDVLLGDRASRTARPRREPGKVYSAEDLRAAIHHGEIVAFYQPKVSVETGALIGVEALARWQHPVDGLILPGGFIDLVEQHGLMEELTRVMFVEALREIRDLEQSGLSLQVAINLAPPTLGSVRFADFLAAQAAESSIPPHRIVLELTESQIVGDMRDALDVLTRLGLMRFKLSIDDFGTGYSSLGQLQELPFDELKIDRSFVHRAHVDKTARAIYDASYHLAKQLGMATVAEGVEDQADWDFVKGTHCDTAQGFFIGRPMPRSELDAWAKAWRDRQVSGFV